MMLTSHHQLGPHVHFIWNFVSEFAVLHVKNERKFFWGFKKMLTNLGCELVLLNISGMTWCNLKWICWLDCLTLYIVNNVGNSWVTKVLSVPLPAVPLPIKPIGFPVKMSPKTCFLGQKIWFWACFKAHGYGFWDLYLYPHLPISFTHMGLHTPVIH